MLTASRRTAAGIAILGIVMVLAGVKVTHASAGRFRIDETLKISESAFFGLLMQGRFFDPAWSGTIIDRATPPVGKYGFGLAIELSGRRVPPVPTLNVRTPAGNVPMVYPDDVAAPYLPYLPAVRHASTVCVALIAAILGWMTARTASALSALFALVLFCTSYLTNLLWATAVFDPLLILFATVLLLLATHRSSAASCVLAGIVGGLAMETRLNGALFFGLTVLILLVAEPKRWRSIVLSGVAFVATAFAVNPYYWPSPISRVVQQFHDIHTLLDGLLASGRGFSTPGAKIRFAFEYLFGDVPGSVLFVSTLIAVYWLVTRWRTLNEPALRGALWCGANVVVFLWWLPVAWPRYLFAIVPSLCFLAAVGTTGFISEASSLVRFRSAKKIAANEEPE